MNEIFALGDRVTVLRDGMRVHTGQVDQLTEEAIIRLMVGRPIGEHYGKVSSAQTEAVLSVRGLSVEGHFSDVGFDLRRGEVLGLAGLIGAGRTELLNCLFGALPADRGEIVLHGKPVVIRSPAQAAQLGVGLVPEDRRESGLLLQQSTETNITLTVLERIAPRWFIDFLRRKTLATSYVEQLRIKTPSLQQRVGNLSGGNQQKVVLSKWLAAGSNILLLDEPTRGIDVNAKAEIYHLINDLTTRGMSIIMASSELPEVLGMSDRILVMAEGWITKEFSAAEATQEAIMQHALPVSGKAAQRSAQDENADNRLLQRALRWISGKEIWLILLMMLIGAFLLLPDFGSTVNLRNLSRQSAVIGVLAIAQFIVIVSGGFDLSVGAMIALISVLAASLSKSSMALALILPLFVGLSLGTVNGIAVTFGRIPPLITTLAMAGIARGFAFAISEKSILAEPVFREIGSLAAGVVTFPLIVWLVVMSAVFAFVRLSPIGTYIYALGGREDTARLAGVPTRRVKVLVYALSGLLAAAAGVLFVARSGSGVPTVGTGWELDTIAGVVIGGTNLFGGEGDLLKAMCDVLIYLLIGNLLNLAGVDPYYQDLVKGGVILVTVWLSLRRLKGAMR